MKNRFGPFVDAVLETLRAAREIPCGGMEPCATPGSLDAGLVLLFSPHPDDECITGLLPLRLMRESGMKIINIPVTFGSDPARQSERAEELKNACRFLGWECLDRDFPPLDGEGAQKILETFQPDILFLPHAGDWNSRHLSTHLLVREALAGMEKSFSCTVVETEFWHAMDAPNLMVEADAGTLADLVAATSFHIKEVGRNPYHLSLPAWMQDNVRRGCEVVGGQGGGAPDFFFATLYRLLRWENGALHEVRGHGRFLSAKDNPGNILTGVQKWKS